MMTLLSLKYLDLFLFSISIIYKNIENSIINTVNFKILDKLILKDILLKNNYAKLMRTSLGTGDRQPYDFGGSGRNASGSATGESRPAKARHGGLALSVPIPNDAESVVRETATSERDCKTLAIRTMELA